MTAFLKWLPIGGHLAVLLFSITLAAGAEDIELTVTERLLRRPVSAPSRSESTLGETTRPASTITRQEIESQGARTVKEALKLLPGILPDGTTGTEVNGVSGQFIRGSNSSQVLILLDGRPINDLGFGGFNLSEISTDVIERIELLPGGGSTLYGSDALGGIINIVTTQPGDTPTYRIGAEVGSLGLNSQQVSLSDRDGPLSLLLSFNRTQAQNNYRFTVGGVTDTRSNNEILFNNLRLQLGYTPSDRTKLRFNALYLARNQGVPGGVPVPEPVFGQGFFNALTDANRRYNDQVFTDLRLEQKLGLGEDSTLTARVYVDFLNDRFDARTTSTNSLGVDNSGNVFSSRTPAFPQRFETRQRSVGTQIQHRWQLAPNQSLTYGVDYRNTRSRNVTQDLVSDSLDVGFDGEVSQGAVFSQYGIDIFPTLSVNLGLRQEVSSLANGSVTSPAVGTKLSLGDTSLRANYIRNFRTPSISDLFSTNPFFLGNPNLVPESGDSYDVGIDQKLGDIGLLRLTYFVNNISNLIAFTNVSPPINGVSGTFSNIGFVQTTGLEASLNIQVAPYIFFLANYTNNDPRILSDNNGNTIGNELRFAGADAINLGLSYDHPNGLYLGLLMHSISGYPTNNSNTEFLSGYTTFDLRWKIPLTRSVVFNGGIENLFDQRFQLFAGFPDSGRIFRLGVGVTF